MTVSLCFGQYCSWQHSGDRCDCEPHTRKKIVVQVPAADPHFKAIKDALLDDDRTYTNYAFAFAHSRFIAAIQKSQDMDTVRAICSLFARVKEHCLASIPNGSGRQECIRRADLLIEYANIKQAGGCISIQRSGERLYLDMGSIYVWIEATSLREEVLKTTECKIKRAESLSELDDLFALFFAAKLEFAAQRRLEEPKTRDCVALLDAYIGQAKARQAELIAATILSQNLKNETGK